MAGSSGFGSSSKLDDVILRDRNSDRVYLCQNWRGDVVAVLGGTGYRKLQSVRYSAYGVPFALPQCDVNGDGAVSGDNFEYPYSGPYDARYDIDLDDDIDINDWNLIDSADGQSLGYGVLSDAAIALRKGYAGYEHDGVFQTTAHVRHRVLLTELGRWTRRDPLGYVDGMGLYAYVANRATNSTDPLGTDPWELVAPNAAPILVDETGGGGPCGCIHLPCFVLPCFYQSTGAGNICDNSSQRNGRYLADVDQCYICDENIRDKWPTIAEHVIDCTWQHEQRHRGMRGCNMTPACEHCHTILPMEMECAEAINCPPDNNPINQCETDKNNYIVFLELRRLKDCVTCASGQQRQLVDRLRMSCLLSNAIASHVIIVLLRLPADTGRSEDIAWSTAALQTNRASKPIAVAERLDRLVRQQEVFRTELFAPDGFTLRVDEEVGALPGSLRLQVIAPNGRATFRETIPNAPIPRRQEIDLELHALVYDERAGIGIVVTNDWDQSDIGWWSRWRTIHLASAQLLVNRPMKAACDSHARFCQQHAWLTLGSGGRYLVVSRVWDPDRLAATEVELEFAVIDPWGTICWWHSELAPAATPGGINALYERLRSSIRVADESLAIRTADDGWHVVTFCDSVDGLLVETFVRESDFDESHWSEPCAMPQVLFR